jgi:hypothetical protein
MNKKYDRTDQERDQSRRLEQGDAEKRRAREHGKPERGGQQHAMNPVGSRAAGQPKGTAAGRGRRGSGRWFG